MNLITVKPIVGKKTMLKQAAEECFKDFPLLNNSMKNGKKD